MHWKFATTRVVRRLLITLGALTAVGLIAGLVGLFFLLRMGAAQDAESAAYVERLVSSVLETRNEEEFLSQAAPELIR